MSEQSSSVLRWLVLALPESRLYDKLRVCCNYLATSVSQDTSCFTLNFIWIRCSGFKWEFHTDPDIFYHILIDIAVQKHISAHISPSDSFNCTLYFIGLTLYSFSFWILSGVKILEMIFSGVALWVDADFLGIATALIFWDRIWCRDWNVSKKCYCPITEFRGISSLEAVLLVVLLLFYWLLVWDSFWRRE